MESRFQLNQMVLSVKKKPLGLFTTIREPKAATTVLVSFLASMELEWLREKGRDLTKSYDKTLTRTENSKKESNNTKTPLKTSITQRLRTGVRLNFDPIEFRPVGS